MEEKLNDTNVEVATVTKDDGFKILSADELQAIIAELAWRSEPARPLLMIHLNPFKMR